MHELSSISRAIIFGILFLLPALGEAKVQPPLTARLDLKTTPTAGGPATVIWTGTPQTTAKSAVIIFYLTPPGSELPTTSSSQPLALVKDKTVQTSHTFILSGAGFYRITAGVQFQTFGGHYAKVNSLLLDMPKAGPARLAQETPLSASEFDARTKKKAPQPLALSAPAPTYASSVFTVSGTLKYTDKPFTQNGFTGTAAMPIRRARVNVIGQQGSNTAQVLGSTTTGENGNFSASVTGSGSNLAISVRVTASTPEAEVDDMSGTAYPYTTASTTWPGGNMSLGTVTIAVGGSGPWNILDVLLKGHDYVGSAGATLPKAYARWASGNTLGTYTDLQSGTIYILGQTDDPDEFDDSVIMHELGHFVASRLSYDKTPGGSHTWDMTTENPALAWSEGWATFFSSAVRNNRYYYDYSLPADPQTGMYGFSLDLESDTIKGDRSEAAIATSLWDIFDSRNDGADALSDGLTHIWPIFDNFFNSSRDCVMHDFYNGWVANGYPSLAAVQAILDEHGINYGWSSAVLPKVSRYAINNGAGSTASRTVTLNNSCTGNPTQYLASESSSFSGAIWAAYSAAPSFTLSTGSGTKTVYFKVRDLAGNESAVSSDQITLSLSAPAVNSFSINNGAASSASRVVTLNNTCGGTPTKYMASESSTFSGAGWAAYSTAPSFTLSAGNGAKTVYFKVQDASGQSSDVKSDTITLSLPAPAVSAFSINNGAPASASRVVTLNNTCTGTPDQYLASESSSFSGASWATYSAAPTFTLSAGNGTKTVYFKVMNSSLGQVSAVASATISLNVPPPTYGTVNIIPSLPAAAWTLTDGSGATFSGSGAAMLSVVTGNITLQWLAQSGYALPAPATQSQALATGGAITFTGIYLAAGNPQSAQAAKVVRYLLGLDSSAGGLDDNGDGNVDIADLLYEMTPGAGSFAINNGAASTESRTVTLNNACTGNPAQYMASESSTFSGAVWSAYSTAPTFTLSTGYGTKTVYFKVKNAAGVVSAVASDTISLTAPAPTVTTLTVNGPTLTGKIASAGDKNYYQFTITTPGWYTIRTTTGTLSDGTMSLYQGTSTSALAVADDQGSYMMPMISMNLAAGTYQVQFEGYASDDIGTYSISLKSGSIYTGLNVDGAKAQGNISWGWDVDWYRFTVTAQGIYTIDATSGTLTDARMYLYREGGTDPAPLTINDDKEIFGSYDTMPTISTTLAPGTYTVAVEGYAQSDQGTYSIQVRGGNSHVAMMTLIDNGLPVANVIDSATDEDWYELEVFDSGSYTLTTTKGTLSEAQMSLYQIVADSNGDLQPKQLDYDDGSSGVSMPKITATLDPGTYYVWFTGINTSDIGTYSIKLASQ